MAPAGSALVASWYVCLIPAAPLILLRLRSRWRRFEKFGIDDFVFITAILVVLGFNATIANMWNQGLADWKDGERISGAQLAAILQMVLPSQLLYISAAWAIKFSVVLFYRIVAPPGSRVVTMCYVVLGYLVVSWTVVFFYTLFGCRWWDKSWAEDLSNKCSADFTLITWWMLTCSNTSANVIVVVLPITMAKKLDMRRRDKCAISFMFVLGFVVIAASGRQAYFNKQNDMMLTATASMGELSAGLMATSLLALSKTLLGKNAFKASTSRRRSLGLGTSHHKAHQNELKLLEAYKNEKDKNSKRSSLSITGADGSGVATSLHSRTRSTTSKDSSFVPDQIDVILPMGGGGDERGGHWGITIYADPDEEAQHRKI